MLNGINDNGDLAGEWGPASNGSGSGFVYLKSTNTFVDVHIPNSTRTVATGISYSGEIVGYYYSGSTVFGFTGHLTQ
jgi:hypothetical protein